MLDFPLETFRLGLKNLRLHKLRSLLTALGVILGVAAVIVMVAIGEGTKRAALERIQQLGARNILVRSTPPPESSEAAGRTQRVLSFGLTRGDLQRLRELPDVESVVPLRNTEQRVVRGDLRTTQASAIGTTPAVFDVVNLRLTRGEFLHATPPRPGRAGLRDRAGRGPATGPLRRPARADDPRRLVDHRRGPADDHRRAGAHRPARRQRGGGHDEPRPRPARLLPLSLARDTFGDTIIKQQSGSMERKRVSHAAFPRSSRASTRALSVPKSSEALTQ